MDAPQLKPVQIDSALVDWVSHLGHGCCDLHDFFGGMVFVRFDPNTGRYPSFLIFYSGSPKFKFFRIFVWPFLCRQLRVWFNVSFMVFTCKCFILGCFPPWKLGATPKRIFNTKAGGIFNRIARGSTGSMYTRGLRRLRKVPRFNCRVVWCRSWSLCNLERSLCIQVKNVQTLVILARWQPEIR